MPSFATPEGTIRYAARFPAAAKAGHFRRPFDERVPNAPLMSSVGLGTYLGEADAETDSAYAESVLAAIEGGINVVDSAINYRYQRSERSVGVALRNAAAAGIARDEIVLCTKGGFLTPDGELPEDPSEYFGQKYIRPGILRADDIAAGCHVMSPKFLTDQLQRSLENLGVDCVDVYYLHNPETQLADVPREEFLRRLARAFEFLESACAAGSIRYYGMATWNGFRQPADAKEYLSLAEAVSLARAAGGEQHHLRFVQAPLNFAMTELLTRTNQQVNGREVAMVEAAKAEGISLIASASLLQAQMAANLPKFIVEAMGLRTDAERAIQFARSMPGVTTALVGMSSAKHVRENLRLITEPAATAEQFGRLFQRGEKA